MTADVVDFRTPGGGDCADDLFRLLSVASRRYSRDPEGRAAMARLILASAIALYAGHTSPGEAALLTSEFLAELGRQERKAGHR